MTPQEINEFISNPDFRLAMKDAFDWRLPLPEEVLRSLVSSPHFERLLKETNPHTFASEMRNDREHFDAFAADERVRLLVEELLANLPGRLDRMIGGVQQLYLSHLMKFVLKQIEQKLDDFLKWLFRVQIIGDDGIPSFPRGPVPVGKSSALIVALLVAQHLYRNPPKIDLNPPKEFPKLQIESSTIRLDSSQVSFPGVKLESPSELRVARLQFAQPPELQVRPLSFAEPPQLKIDALPELKVAEGSHIRLDTGDAHLRLTQEKPLEFSPLQFKPGSELPVRFDGDMLQKFAPAGLTPLFSRAPELHITDQKKGFFWPTHNYTVSLQQPTTGANATGAKSSTAGSPKRSKRKNAPGKIPNQETSFVTGQK